MKRIYVLGVFLLSTATAQPQLKKNVCYISLHGANVMPESLMERGLESLADCEMRASELLKLNHQYYDRAIVRYGSQIKTVTHEK